MECDSVTRRSQSSVFGRAQASGAVHSSFSLHRSHLTRLLAPPARHGPFVTFSYTQLALSSFPSFFPFLPCYHSMADLFDNPPPDFNARTFENIRNAIVDREGGDHNQAAQRLLAAWRADNEHQADQTEQDDQRPHAPQEEQQGEDHPALDAQQANDPPAEGAPNPDKKKAKMADFAEGQAPPRRHSPAPIPICHTEAIHV